MTSFLPRSMTGLVTAGCLLAGLPLLAGLLLAGSALDRLARHTDALVDEGVRIEKAGAALRDQMRDLSRNVEQYFVLGDPALIKVIDGRARAAQAAIQEVEQRGAHVEVAQLRLQLADANRAWKSALDGGTTPEPALTAFAALVPAADGIVQAGQRKIAEQIEEIGAATDAAHRVMALSALALVPLTALFAFGFSRAITRPLKQLAQGIQALGHGRYGQPVEVAYPEEMRTLGEQLEWLRRRTSALEAEKDRFLRHISHELKTPLATLQEGSSLIRDQSLGPLTPQQSEVAHILGDAAIELGGLIGNLLSYAEWKQGERSPGMSWFETEPMISEVLLAHQLAMTRRQIGVKIGEHPPCLYGQRSRLRVALDNLIGNAIKHSPEGGTIDVGAALAAGRCEIYVRDRGRGVVAQEKDRIFEPFVRGTEAEESAVRGTGIGLSIVRETVLAHEGTVEVVDAEPGASFRMAWPCPAVPEP
jgi:two-component system sensor histidine kinase GlrK